MGVRRHPRADDIIVVVVVIIIMWPTAPRYWMTVRMQTGRVRLRKTAERSFSRRIDVPSSGSHRRVTTDLHKKKKPRAEANDNFIRSLFIFFVFISRRFHQTAGISVKFIRVVWNYCIIPTPTLLLTGGFSNNVG